MVTSSRFEQSYVALLAVLWAEFEALFGRLAVAAPPDDEVGTGEPMATAIELHAEAIVLELVLLVERCRSAPWQALLSPLQLQRVEGVACRLLELLDFSPARVDPCRARAAILDAQNFLFDELYPGDLERATA